jgi:hypothetical protein
MLLFIPINRADTFNYDNDMGYVRSVNLTKRTINYMIEKGMFGYDQFSATMPVIYSTTDARFGYMPLDTSNRNCRYIHAGTKYAVQTIPGTPVENPENFPLDTLEHWIDGDIQTIFYKVLPKDTIIMGQ